MSDHAHTHAPCGHAAHHGHSHAGHRHAHRVGTGSLIAGAFWINFAFMLVEFIGGWWTGSLALLADAGHMLNDVLSLGIAWGAHRLASRQADAAFTFGYRRAQVIAALANAASLGAIFAFIVSEASRRLSAPTPIQTEGMFAVAAAGFVANLGSGALLFSRRDESMNLRGAFLHLMADTLGSLAAVVGAVIIYFTGALRVDPILSLLIAALVAWGAWGLMRESVGVLMEKAPHGFSTARLAADLLAIDGVASVHDLHVWQLDDGAPLASVHLVARGGVALGERALLARSLEILAERYGIAHATVQIESADWPECSTHCGDPAPKP